MFRPQFIVFLLLGGIFMQKFIWDLDETLLSADFRKEDDFFKEQILDEKVDEFIKNKVKYLMEYERTFF